LEGIIILSRTCVFIFSVNNVLLSVFTHKFYSFLRYSNNDWLSWPLLSHLEVV
jgi:hypothetical protein